jgi:hypothetical protein
MDRGPIYFNARYYDPITGRFLTEDPSRKGVNWYAYCENDPINRIDPDGLDVYAPGRDEPFRYPVEHCRVSSAFGQREPVSRRTLSGLDFSR